MVFWKREILVRGNGNKQLRIKEKAIPGKVPETAFVKTF